MPSEEVENHLNGLRGFVSNNFKTSPAMDLYYPLSKISHVGLVIGLVIDPGFGGNGKILQFIKNYSNELRCMVFYDNTFFDYDWQILAKLTIK